MEVHNISIDDNDEDTSGDDLEEEDYNSLFKSFQTPEVLSQQQQPIFTTPTEFRTKFSAWERPPIDLNTIFWSPFSQEQIEPFHFFLLDTVSTVTAGVKYPEIKLDSSIENRPLHNVIRLFGVTTRPKKSSTLSQMLDDEYNEFQDHDKTNSISICCNVHGFLSYFYLLPLNTNFEEDVEEYWKSEEHFETWLNEKIKTTILKDITYIAYHDFVSNGKIIARIEVLKASEIDGGVYLFFESTHGSRKDTVLLKIYVTLPRFIWTANNILTGILYKNWKFECYETNLNNTVRYLTDQNMTGCSWMEVHANKYYVRSCAKDSHCQIEIDVHFTNISKLDDSHPRYNFNPAVRVLSFDIEVLVSPGDCVAKDGRKQIIQIGAVLGNYYSGGNAKDSIIGKTVFVLGTCDDIEDAQIVQFYIQENPNSTNEKYMEEAEASMLGSFRDFIIQMDPDIIVGYNIKKFDLTYLLDRSFVLGGRGRDFKNSTVLPYLGRMQKMKFQTRMLQNDHKKVYEHDEKSINIQGRIIFDMYPIIVRHDKFNSSSPRGYYKLSSVAKRYLPKIEEKQDVKYTEIEGLQHGTSTTRNKMAQYCLQDSIIPYLILFEPIYCRRHEITTYLDLYFLKSRTGGTPLRYLLNKSTSYSEYFKQVRIQKNPGKVKYVPDTPSPKKQLNTPGPSPKKSMYYVYKNKDDATDDITINNGSSNSKDSVKRILFPNDP